ncbi:VRR-NUC domain-containing protein [Comamonas antarctica]|uniref:VRR-NUC domain-containing protein n=1 Tax=Comamonas antarctica TaxID=2743470 RepID=UPI0028E55CD4|nr:VRR-NUC domain-containing protein [Comamonas antarctica]
MKEAKVEDYFVDRIKALGGLQRKAGWIGRRDAPDRVAMGIPNHPLGPTIWVELKRPGETPRTSQLREHERMRAAGQIVLVIDSIELVDHHFPLPK